MSDNINEFLENTLIENGAGKEIITNLESEVHSLQDQLHSANQKIEILAEHSLDTQLELANKEEVITTLESEVAHLSQHIQALTHRLNLSVKHSAGFISENAALHRQYGDHLKAANLMLAAAKSQIEKLQKKSPTHSAKTPFIEGNTKKKQAVSGKEQAAPPSEEQSKPFSPKK